MARALGWSLLCLGDLASPPAYDLEGCRFLPLEEQGRLPFALAAIAPTRHYTRKNLGCLLAAADDIGVI